MSAGHQDHKGDPRGLVRDHGAPSLNRAGGWPPEAGGRLRLLIRADGAARGNPGPAAAGAVLIDALRPDARDPDAPPLAVISRPLGIQTNNVAEYRAVQFALEAAQRMGAREIELVLDSKLVVEQLSGRWKIRNVALMPIVRDVQRLLGGFDRWSARHEPRERNRAADALANLALDDPVTAAALEARTSRAPSAAERDPDSAGAPAGGCLICLGQDGDGPLSRLEVWRDALWRLTLSLAAPVPGFGYLEPHRHIPSLLELDGEEAVSLGRVLPAVARVLLRETGAERVYVYVFGERVEHLHFNLAPHRPGDPLRGGRELADPAAPSVPAETLRAVADRVSRALNVRP